MVQLLTALQGGQGGQSLGMSGKRAPRQRCIPAIPGLHTASQLRCCAPGGWAHLASTRWKNLAGLWLPMPLPRAILSW